MSTLRAGSRSRVEVIYELQQGLVEAPELPGRDAELAELASYLKRKYADTKLDLILSMAAPQVRILLEKDPGLFGNVPKVFYEFDTEREATNRSLGPNITGVWANLDFDKTLDLALALHPDTRKVIVISGHGPEDKLKRERAQAEFRKYESRAEFSYLIGDTIEQLRSELATLDKNSVVIFLMFTRDKEGNRYSGPEAISMIAPASSAPIYGYSDTLMGLGITGGNLLDFEGIGKRIGEMGLRVLAGERPEQIPQETAPTVMMVDWRQLQRWGISEQRLPPGSVVRFRQPSFWELYKWHAIGLVAAVIIEAMLIAWLLFLRARRRQAEEDNLRLARLAQAERKELNEVVSNVPGIVWETRVEPGTKVRKTTFISDYVGKMLGYTAAEWLSQPSGLGFRLIPDEAERERAMRDSEAVMTSGKEGVTRSRWITKDGRTLWVESHLTPIFDDDRKVVGMRGVTLDVTNRERAIDELRQSEERFGKAFRANPQPMSLTTIGDGRYFDVNASFLAMSGYTRDEVIGHTSLELKVWETDKARADFAQQLVEQGSIVNIEITFRTKTGSLRVLLSSAESLEIAGEKCILIASSDITERKEAEDALRTAHEEVSRLKNQLQEENIYLREEIKLEQNFGEIVGRSDALKYVLFKIEQVAPTDSTVLITGETGTGKELVARAIHNASARHDRPLVKVNCAALSASLIESELFGHEKGAFTGASARKIGRFELADGATIFLDEIGELPTELQVKLLRVIQEGEFERLGSSKTIKADGRIIAATNRNLDLDVKKGLFREDLWYRLNVFPITVPPLRQRREDIPLLVEHFAQRFAKKLGKVITTVSPATLKTLLDYSWPGNVRELANVIERAVINTQGSVLRIGEDFGKPDGTRVESSDKTLEEMERDYIIRILADTAWRIEGPRGAARILGLNPSTLRTRMAKLGIQKPGQSFSEVGQ